MDSATAVKQGKIGPNRHANTINSADLDAGLRTALESSDTKAARKSVAAMGDNVAFVHDGDQFPLALCEAALKAHRADPSCSWEECVRRAKAKMVEDANLDKLASKPWLVNTNSK